MASCLSQKLIESLEFYIVLDKCYFIGFIVQKFNMNNDILLK